MVTSSFIFSLPHMTLQNSDDYKLFLDSSMTEVVQLIFFLLEESEMMMMITMGCIYIYK